VPAALNGRDASSAIGTEAKLAFLSRPGSFPGQAHRVDAIETHMSWVFLTDNYAYKLKKPVRLAPFDARTLAARRRYCDEEVRLNRRLAPDVYLGVVALRVDTRGRLQLGGDGAVVDWLVRMRRLPAAHMLDRAIGAGSVRQDDLRRVAAHLAAFYRAASPLTIDAGAYRAAFARDVDRNRRALTRPAYGLAPGPVRDLCAAQQALLAARADWLDERVRLRRIVEGHGDLRPEHICLAPQVSVIDCLEFARPLRIVDPADELGFLALECERLGAAAAGTYLLRAVGRLTGDRPHTGLVHLYQSLRAALRARIAIRHLDDERFRQAPTWRHRAETYLQLAQRHLARAHAAARAQG
jgi:aminoglycoside phosphotransferase family enzyme